MNTIYARKTTMKNVSLTDEKWFLDNYHYQGYVHSSWCKGLYYNDELVILMSFGKPRYNRKADWELLRLCTKKDAIVVGGASKLFKAFLKDEPFGNIVSYCNNDKFDGKVYEILGFEYETISKGYHYEKDGVKYNRLQFQRRKLSKYFSNPEYDNPILTENDIMTAEGFTRVNDIFGQARWVYKREDNHHCYYIYEVTDGKYHYIGQHKYLVGADIYNDNYYGSGAIVRRMRMSKNLQKTIIEKDIATQKEADEREVFYIKASRERYGFINDGGYNVNIRVSGQGSFGATYATLGRKSMIDVNGKKHFVHSEKVDDFLKKGWTLGSFKTNNLKPEHIEKMRATKKKGWAEGRYDLSGEKNGMYGKHHTDEAKKKLAECGKRRIENIKSIIPNGWTTLNDKMKETGLSRFLVLKKYEWKEIMYGKTKIIIVH